MRRAIGHRQQRFLAVLACLGAALAGGHARPAAAACSSGMALDAPIARASQRFVLPDTLIRAVIAVESGGAVFAVSPKGAMGLMQLMPGTWAELRQRYGLGADPFDPCDNIFAGTAYLRELLDRYGDPGFLAAYNAGPGRYEAYLGGRPLPPETIAYVATLSGRMMGGTAPVPVRALPDPDAWRRGDLFVRAPKPAAESSDQPSETSSPEPQRKPDLRPSELPRNSIFVPRTGVPK
ncbi:lytic transglycosylase domain-containing protein [Sphingomonas suaedae]|uniref:Lytic transglycosylase domain-containing protein n=1 Tax=Sphingomonas suaedae TaxID=2599297 RepID=A0A518RHV4_9SPHN|nr:lytic transglycosylase domain-containing protein [Sphingomonas suaedae]QDX27011.1 lytic transglycosylase domain-containing protein [Sphingomonas suaedae]